MASDIIRLNVGGTFYDTTLSTLNKCSYFEICLDGRFSNTLDGDRLFVDRNGLLFGILLDFMRTGLRPPATCIAAHKNALLEECAFFGLEHMSARISGLVSPLDLRWEDRQIFERSKHVDADLIDVFASSDMRHAKPSVSLELPLLFADASPAPKISCGGHIGDFLHQMDDFIGTGMVKSLQKLGGDIIVCGG